MVVQPRFRRKIDDAAARAGFRVGRRIHQALNARVKNRADAHRARLQCHIQGAIQQTVIGQMHPGCAHRHDFGMRGGIGGGNRAVITAPDDDAIAHHHRADWYLAAILRLLRKLQCGLHEISIAPGFQISLGFVRDDRHCMILSLHSFYATLHPVLIEYAVFPVASTSHFTF